MKRSKLHGETDAGARETVRFPELSRRISTMNRSSLREQERRWFTSACVWDRVALSMALAQSTFPYLQRVTDPAVPRGIGLVPL